MEAKFDLKKMLAEIREDQAAETTKYRKLSRDGVRSLVVRKQQARGRQIRDK